KKAFRFMKGSKGDISKELILKLHDLIQRNIDHDSAGALRRIGVNITGSEWQPTPAIMIGEELDELISWYRENRNEIPPFELAALFHIRFVQIHPFTDANGRVGRELLNYILARNDYPPIIIPIERREEYMDNLTLADEGDPLPLMEFLALQLIRDHANVVRSIKEKFTGDLRDIKPGEMEEMVGLMTWFFNLIGELDLKVPPHARSEIEQIHRQFLSDLDVDPDLIRSLQS
ncbi:MAG: Fic family protein, partial [Thermoplasmata archaeon]|nr:Fic family protein [Thermoplasmata archaeon]